MSLPVSIVIPTLNEEKYLPKLLKSIKDQTKKPTEVIVADNGSKDKTLQIARRFGCTVIKGGRPGVGRNSGAKVAKSELLLFLDADVILQSDFLEKTTAEFNKRHLDIATCLATPLSKVPVDRLLHETANVYFLLSKSFLTQLNGFCIFVTKKLYEKTGGFDEKIILAEDFDFLKRAKKYGKFGYLESKKIQVSVRRLQEEGRLVLSFKLFLLQFYLLFKGGVRTDLFKYRLGRHK